MRQDESGQKNETNLFELHNCKIRDETLNETLEIHAYATKTEAAIMKRNRSASFVMLRPFNDILRNPETVLFFCLCVTLPQTVSINRVANLLFSFVRQNIPYAANGNWS